MPKEGEGVNDYMEVLVKETVTLHKVLSRYLPSSVVEVRRLPCGDERLCLLVGLRAVRHDAGLRCYQPPALGGVYED